MIWCKRDFPFVKENCISQMLYEIRISDITDHRTCDTRTFKWNGKLSNTLQLFVAIRKHTATCNFFKGTPSQVFSHESSKTPQSSLYVEHFRTSAYCNTENLFPVGYKGTWDKVLKSRLNKSFKRCLPQNFFSPLLNTLSHLKQGNNIILMSTDSLRKCYVK